MIVKDPVHFGQASPYIKELGSSAEIFQYFLQRSMVRVRKQQICARKQGKHNLAHYNAGLLAAQDAVAVNEHGVPLTFKQLPFYTELNVEIMDGPVDSSSLPYHVVKPRMPALSPYPKCDFVQCLLQNQ